jgi:hypothetical protein
MNARSDERGATLVIVGIMLIAIFGFVVIVIDVGGLLTLRRSLVRASDSAALAAAQSFAKNEGGAAPGQADSFAGSNVDSPTRTLFSTQAGIPGMPCSVTSCGSVTVRYTKDQPLYFAPVLGLASVEDVQHTSKAIWGPPGANVPVVPLVATDDALLDCDLPNAAAGRECTMFYEADGDGTTSASEFGWLDLSTAGWNVGPGAGGCSGTGASTLNGWLGTPVTTLSLNWPFATYVCPAGGVRDTNWQTLNDMADAHVIVSFPVTDADGLWSAANGGTAPHGKIDGASGGTAKYDAVGFVSLRLVALYDGSEPEVRGIPEVPAVPASTQSCPGWPKTLAFDKVPPAAAGEDEEDLTLAMDTCSALVGQPVLEPPLVRNKTLGTDYTYNALTDVIKWQDFGGANGDSEIVTLQYVRPGTLAIPAIAGACGPHYDAMNQDKCLVTETVGFTSSGGDPGGGGDFGIRTWRLSR